MEQGDREMSWVEEISVSYGKERRQLNCQAALQMTVLALTTVLLPILFGG